ALDRPADAAACYGTSIALAPRLAPLYVQRGMAYLRGKQVSKARADFDRAVELQPDLAESYLQRAIALAHLVPPENAAALRDIKQAGVLGAPRGRVLLMEAKVHERLGDPQKARAARNEGLLETPQDEAGWLARGYAHLQLQGRDAALKDFEQALVLN